MRTHSLKLCNICGWGLIPLFVLSKQILKIKHFWPKLQTKLSVPQIKTDMVLKSLKKEDQSKLCFNKCYGKKIQQNITFILLVTGPTQGVVKSVLVKRGQKKGRSLVNDSESAVPPSPLTVAELYHSDLSKEEYLEQNHGIQKSSHKASFLF